MAVGEALNELKMESVMSDNYDFYYPKGWIKNNNLPEAELGYILVNEQGKETGEAISLQVVQYDDDLEPATEDFCIYFAQSFANLDPEMIGNVESVFVTNSHPKYQGCVITISYKYGGTNALSEIKSIWFKDGRDNNMYIDRGNYFITSDAETVNIIKDSVSSFTLK